MKQQRSYLLECRLVIQKMRQSKKPSLIQQFSDDDMLSEEDNQRTNESHKNSILFVIQIFRTTNQNHMLDLKITHGQALDFIVFQHKLLALMKKFMHYENFNLKNILS